MKKYILYICLLFVWTACTETIHIDKTAEEPLSIFPDYAGVTIPANIAPLNFTLTTGEKEAYAFFAVGENRFEVKAKDGKFIIPVSKWKKMLETAVGNKVTVTVAVKRGEEWVGYAPFFLYVAKEPMDSYLAYRLIDPGYVLWNQMGIYQRNLEGYTQSTIIENKSTHNNCMNCHSFCMQNPDKMLFHMREKLPGTILVNGDKIEKLNTKTDQTISSLVYPSWHPSGRYVAFSVNNTKQAFHMNDKNRIEVYDEASDVVVYDVEKHEIVTAPVLFSSRSFETFPTFSPDGKTLYFCSADAQSMPESYNKLKYNLCSVAFNPDTRSFGTEVDTLYNVDMGGKSVSFPRVSPDGHYLLCTLSGYGNFSIWHKDADLYLFDLQKKECRPLEEVNSDDVESYHSWSSNSRWFVFSSRRIDGLYTRPYFAYIDEEGKAGKPFLLPQKDPDYYSLSMKSYNIPEFIKDKVKVRERVLSLKAKEDKGIDVKFN